MPNLLEPGRLHVRPPPRGHHWRRTVGFAYSANLEETHFLDGTVFHPNSSNTQIQIWRNERELPGKRINGYILKEEIGEGAFASVWLCVHEASGFPVAVKIIGKESLKTEEQRATVQSELHIFSSLDHPFICGFYESFEDDERHYLVMEHCAAGLKQVLAEAGRLQPEDLRLIISELVIGIGYIHSHGLIDRDLKLDNIMVDANKNIKIVDFGLSTDASQEHSKRCGSIGYLAPEMVRGEAYGTAIDVWALGVLLHGLADGCLPFQDEDEHRVLQKICFSDVAYPPLPEDLGWVLERMLDRNPATRITIAGLRTAPALQATIEGIEAFLEREAGREFEEAVATEVELTVHVAEERRHTDGAVARLHIDVPVPESRVRSASDRPLHADAEPPIDIEGTARIIRRRMLAERLQAVRRIDSVHSLSAGPEWRPPKAHSDIHLMPAPPKAEESASFSASLRRGHALPPPLLRRGSGGANAAIRPRVQLITARSGRHESGSVGPRIPDPEGLTVVQSSASAHGPRCESPRPMTRFRSDEG